MPNPISRSRFTKSENASVARGQGAADGAPHGRIFLFFRFSFCLVFSGFIQFLFLFGFFPFFSLSVLVFPLFFGVLFLFWFFWFFSWFFLSVFYVFVFLTHTYTNFLYVHIQSLYICIQTSLYTYVYKVHTYLYKVYIRTYTNFIYDVCKLYIRTYTKFVYVMFFCFFDFLIRTYTKFVHVVYKICTHHIQSLYMCIFFIHQQYIHIKIYFLYK